MRQDRKASIALSLQVFGKIHALVQNTDDVNKAGAGDAIENEIRAYRQLVVALADLRNGSTGSLASNDVEKGLIDGPDVAVCLFSFQRSVV